MTSDPEEKKANRLIHATSPYLLQHAYNPVDWYEWGSEALDKASAENKPILVSIGYSACHWCHVMERESFEKENIAQIMNAHFVCIKVDREERPDIDQVYMEAVQAMGGHGGWPLNVFLNPARQPFYGGTYFPPENWVRVLEQINQAFQQKRKEIDASAHEINQLLKVSDLQRFSKSPEIENFHIDNLEKMVDILETRFDPSWGGLEKAPKFVMPTRWMFLLRYYAITKKTGALHMVTHTLTKMSQAGLYDQLGGGFSRYSVDREWFAPHFEKMLYDNAQLLSLYAEAYSVTRNPLFKTIVYETVAWLQREMTHTEGGFYSALDADSEGVEGKFYTWTYDEVKNVLGDRMESFSRYFNITPEGNWEHGRNILNRAEQDPGIAPSSEKEKLMEVRNHRVWPGLDDKILTGWNAMTIQGLTDAYRTFGEPQFLALAKANIRFIEKNLIEEGKVFRSFKNKRSATGGFLEDYAFLIQAYTALYQSTFDEAYIQKAAAWCAYTLTHFFDEKEGFFNFSGKEAEPLIARKKEIFDNVIPASNSVMARNLYRLGILLDKEEWKKTAVAMVSQLGSIIQSEPGYMSHWGILMAEMTQGMAEVVIVGPVAEAMRMEFSGHYQPFSMVMGTTSKSELPLFEGRSAEDKKTRIYVCFNKACKLPVETVAEAIGQLR
jgi:uncharacterized protein YyaL (SSP411 family)